jgi:F0F1-type ATP synthase membrane subunit b/b'
MLAWLTGLFTLRVKLIAIAGIIILAWWWHQHEIAKAYSRAAVETRKEVLKEQEADLQKRIQDERQKLEAEYTDKMTELETRSTALAAERSTLNGQRSAISSELRNGIASLTGRDAAIRAQVAARPPGVLVPDIREALTRIRMIEAGGGGQ